MVRRHPWTIIAIAGVALITLAVVGQAQPWRQRPEPLPAVAPNSFRFELELQGQRMESYSECSGLGSSNEIEQETIEADGGLVVTRQFPGALQWHNIKLRRIGPSDISIWQWRRAMEDGDFAAIWNGSIVMFRPGSSEELARWDFRDGWAADLRFDGEVEELTIVHEGLLRIYPGQTPPLPRR